jgi:hypothetical protein
MYFEIVGDITEVETIAAGPAIRQLSLLLDLYGEGPMAEAEGHSLGPSREW